MKAELKKWRGQRTIPAAAKALKVSPRTYEKWESGEHLPQGDNLRKLLALVNFKSFEPFAGKKILRWREQNNYTQREAAEALEISQSFLAKLEKNSQRCPPKVLTKLKSLN